MLIGLSHIVAGNLLLPESRLEACYSGGETGGKESLYGGSRFVATFHYSLCLVRSFAGNRWLQTTSRRALGRFTFIPAQSPSFPFAFRYGYYIA